MKLIKFNLPLNGTSIGTLEKLQKNFTAEVLDHFRSEKLVKWLRVRNLTEQAQKLDQLFEEEENHEIQLFEKLNAIFGIEIDETLTKTLLVEHKKMLPCTQKAIDDEIEIITKNFAKKEIEYKEDIVKIQTEVGLVVEHFDKQESVHSTEIEELISAVVILHGMHYKIFLKIQFLFNEFAEEKRDAVTLKEFMNLTKDGNEIINEANSITENILSKFNRN